MTKLNLLDKEVVRKDVREVMEALSEKVLVSEFAQFITSDLLVNSFTEELVESLEDGRADFCAKASKVGRRVELWVYRDGDDVQYTGEDNFIQKFVIRAMAETPNADNRKYAHKTVEFIFAEEQD
jgi:hypothetical protein